MLGEALAQIPSRHRRDVLVTVNGADATRELAGHLTTPNAMLERRIRYLIGFNLDHRARTAITTVPQGAWQAVQDTACNPRDLAYGIPFAEQRFSRLEEQPAILRRLWAAP